ncbi:TlpA disulfide reductase family protein [Bosea sp. (in: a-proteobacteria)]|uniref:TlpA disulfide reductase family protein n=1 Tax=Bosea sp. (in: a-proteobacteria) TaxID=1871050 RepID=UPI00333F33A8
MSAPAPLTKTRIDGATAAGKDALVLAVSAPEFRGATGPNWAPKRSFLRLALGVALCVLSGTAAGAAGGLERWSSPETPELALERLDAGPLALAELRGKPVIVHFFATWCGPCIAEMASLNALARRGDPAVTIIAVNVGEVPARLRSFFKARPVDFPVLLDEDRAATKRWQVLGLPASFVLDAKLHPALRAEEPLDWLSPPVLEALSGLERAGSAERPRATAADKKGGPIR